MPSRWSLNLDPAYRSSMVISVVITLLITLVATVSFFLVQADIPLFYSLARPVDQLVPKLWLFLFPLFAVTVTVTHLLLLNLLDHLNPLIKQLFGWSTIVIEFLILVALLRILVLIT